MPATAITALIAAGLVDFRILMVGSGGPRFGRHGRFRRFVISPLLLLLLFVLVILHWKFCNCRRDNNFVEWNRRTRANYGSKSWTDQKLTYR